MNELKHFTICATDGDIGHVCDVLFDDSVLVARYPVVETGGWMSSRKVLIPSLAIHNPNQAQKGGFPFSMTREQVRKSPDIDTDKPVSRKHETDILGYCGHRYH